MMNFVSAFSHCVTRHRAWTASYLKWRQIVRCHRDGISPTSDGSKPDPLLCRWVEARRHSYFLVSSFCSCAFFSRFSTFFCIPSYIFCSFCAPSCSTFWTSLSLSAELLSSLPQAYNIVTTSKAAPRPAKYFINSLLLISESI